ncbi:hypothetical protein BCR41DRAFT_353007 [Lobosporangium transversale]|uniref:Uncharacterized protein n=1 Tax=Lobosporangium transversale TaxID=64571 RepID=A0A1Y2GNT7_9FUNG|nr:hypothetical protein BCR41DRAFT_353007 [Lobosporangium transversale]ORZ16718.1 hypothetical protein BCR41DRAFT_353007 [Lobosporangium transversale]|eukprot:XP_021881653.1 hypothetical protein BCR41DRAFT_353007 [Lobosporangium transversale]
MSDIEFFLRENKKVKKYSDFPTPPWSPRYVYLSEHALVDVLWANEDTKQLLERILPLNNASKTAMYECVQGTKGVLIQALFCDIGGDRMVHGYRDKVFLQSQDKDITRFKLKETISTNGLVLNLLAYDTTQTKRQQQSDVDEEDPSQELEFSQGFLNTTCSKAAGEDLTDEDYANINWKRSSKLLENVELTFNKPGRCPSANTTTIVGCDPGIVNALTFSSLDPHNPNLRQTVKVRSRFLYLPVLRFNHLLNKRKREKGMIEVESAIPCVWKGCVQRVLSMDERRIPDTDRIKEFGCASRVLRVQMAPKKKKWDLRKAQRATFDYAVQRVLKMLGEKGVLVVGLGSFESSKGVPSKHTTITRHLVTQVKARGHFTVGAHEFYTSARCPRPLCDSFLEAVYPCSKYCRACKVFFDRDAVGAENIARIGLAQIERQERPAKCKPSEESSAPGAKRARR